MKCPSELTCAIYADGELSHEESQQVSVHLAECARCRMLVDDLLRENKLLARILRETEDVPAPVASIGAVRTPHRTNVLWMALFVLCAAAGRSAFGRLSQQLPPGMDWINPFSFSAQSTLLFSSLFYFIQGVPMLLSIATTIAILVLTLLTLAGGFVLLRRWPGMTGMLTTVTLTLVLALSGYAMETRRSRNTTVPAGQTIDDTLVAVGETVTIEGTVTGDLIAFARRVTVRGTVKGDVISFSQSLDVEGTVEGSIFGFAQLLHTRGRVARNIYGFAQRIQLDTPGRVEGHIVAFGEEADVEGTVGRDVTGFAGSIYVRGNVGRHLVAHVKRLTLLPSARVGGDMTVEVTRREGVVIDSGATVLGKTDIWLPQRKPSRYLRLSFYGWQLVWLGAAFLTGLFLFWIFPILFGTQLDTGIRLLRAAGVGFLVLVATPVAALILGITLVGLPIALLSLGIWLAGLYLAKIVAAAFVGQALLQRRPDRIASFAVALLVGLLLIFVAINIPYVGGWINFLVILLGLGAAFSQLYNRWQRPVAAL